MGRCLGYDHLSIIFGNILLYTWLIYCNIGTDIGSYENIYQASVQIINNMKLLVAVAMSTIVIGPFNYFGTNLTKYSSAMHRCLIDASRMCIVWLISIFSGWEIFKPQQALGYLFVMVGNLVYYEVNRNVIQIIGKKLLKHKEEKTLKEEENGQLIKDNL
jgi:hypothetical protein